MFDFIEAVRNQTFMQYALLMGVLASVACGIIGSYVVVKRIVFISGGIAHTILGGMGIAYYFGYHPMWGAIPCAILAALIIGLISLRTHQREDTIIGALWAVGMATGIVFISLTPGYKTDLMSYLFGNILMVTQSDIWATLVLDILIVLIVWLYYKQFLAVCFDEEYAKLQGMRTEAIYLLLLCLIALTVVLLIQVVGIILVIALLTLPAAVAGQFARSLGEMMIFAIALGILFTTSGMFVSYHPNLPTGATIIIIAGVFFLLTTVFRERFIRSQKRELSSN